MKKEKDYLKIEKKQIARGDICPICRNGFAMCQCMYGGSSHPNRALNQKVVLEHLHFLTKKQIKHIIELEKYWQVSYNDEKCCEILAELQKDRGIEVIFNCKQ